MRVEKIIDPNGSGQLVDHYIFENGEHAVMTGPIQGVVTLDDGTAINVSQPFVAVASEEQAAELSDKIGMRWIETGHPEDVDTLEDPDTGKQVIVQRPFEFTDSTGETHVSEIGTPVGDHPLDYQLGEHDDEQAAAGAEAYRALQAEAAGPAPDTTKEG